MLNRVTLIGFLGRDPEVRYTQRGDDIANFTVATSSSYKKKETGELITVTEWHKVVIFNPHFCKVAKTLLKKGSKVYVEGELRTRSWMDGEEKKYITEIVVQLYSGCIVLLDKKDVGDLHGNHEGAPHRSDYVSALPIDYEIPF